MLWPLKPKRRMKPDRGHKRRTAALDIGARLSQFVNHDPHEKLHVEPDAF